MQVPRARLNVLTARRPPLADSVAGDDGPVALDIPEQPLAAALKITCPVTFGRFIAIIEPFRQRGRVAKACVA